MCNKAGLWYLVIGYIYKNTLAMKRIVIVISSTILLGLAWGQVSGQEMKSDSAWKKAHKNVVRYSLSNALLFGFDKAVVFGYERVLSPKRSMSLNLGSAALPKLLSIETDSFTIGNDIKNNGFNGSLDYRFYLSKENRYMAPRGIYIGPYYSFNKWSRESSWEKKNAGGNQKFVTTNTDIKLHTLGFELGYQFVIWNRLALDFIMLGPGVGWYNLKTRGEGNLTAEERQQLQDAVLDVIQQKFPGMNYTLSGESFDANGTIRTTSVGFRYMIHIGFNF
jgi:hypothetical protein